MIDTNGVSIVIVNWKSKRYLSECIKSIQENTKALTYEIIIVDNASYDCSNELVVELPNAKYVQLDKNMGFAKANNIGAKKSKMETILFLNPDTVLINDAIAMMHKELWAVDDVGAVGCKLLNSDKTLQTSCIMPRPTLFNLLFDIEYLKLKTPYIPFWGIGPLFKTGHGPWRVEALSGASIMIKRSIFEIIGSFSEDYFMYAEDIDLSMKIQQNDHKLLYVPNACIIHHGGGSTHARKTNKFSTVLGRESMLILLNKFYGKFYGMLYRYLLLCSSLIRLLILMPILIITRPINKHDRTYSIVMKWYYVLSWCLGWEKWATNLKSEN